MFILIWMYFGEFSHPKSWAIYINMFLFCAAIIFLFPFLIYTTRANYQKGDRAKMNDYFIVGSSVILFNAFLVLQLYFFG